MHINEATQNAPKFTILRAKIAKFSGEEAELVQDPISGREGTTLPTSYPLVACGHSPLPPPRKKSHGRPCTFHSLYIKDPVVVFHRQILCSNCSGAPGTYHIPRRRRAEFPTAFEGRGGRGRIDRFDPADPLRRIGSAVDAGHSPNTSKDKVRPASKSNRSEFNHLDEIEPRLLSHLFTEHD